MVRHHCGGRTIQKVLAKEGGGGPRGGLFDDKVIAEGTSEARILSALQGHQLVEVHRRGKLLWFELKPGPDSVLFHFGMTGAFVIKGVLPLTYKDFTIHSDLWPPRFTKLEITFEGDVQLAFVDPRRLGRIRLRAHPLVEPPVALLGPDPVMGSFLLEPFRSVLQTIQAPIKAVLLDQERAVCGIGNWVADEVLYQSAIHPAIPASQLDDLQVAKLHRCIIDICGQACKAQADHHRFPANWLFHYRWRKGRDGAKLPNGQTIVFETCAGRTSAWVPSVQMPYPSCPRSKRKNSENPVGMPASKGCAKFRERHDAEAVAVEPHKKCKATATTVSLGKHNKSPKGSPGSSYAAQAEAEGKRKGKPKKVHV
eukprot:GGOE01063453.1.p1 GENE.GGOE01063453.1~~GGOE01063453.1.p1  ORF type:complete len:393 (+),score=16.71 GGOE01063453.1:78-1181(+)